MDKTAVDIAVERLEKLIPTGNKESIDIILNEVKGIERMQLAELRMDVWMEASRYYNYEDQIKAKSTHDR